MFAIYHALAWGFVLPVLALAMLALDTTNGTAFWQSTNREDDTNV